MKPNETERLSAILPRLAEGSEERLTLAELLGRMKDRAHLALLVLFALPNTLPSIPGTSAITGIPLVYLSLQLAVGRAPWLPGFVSRRSISREALAGVLERAQPWLERGERLLHPRLQHLTGARMERVVGMLMVVMSIAVLLPIPFGNMLPSLVIIFLSLGLMEEDGAWVMGGFVTMVAGIALFATVLWGLFKAAVLMGLSALGF